MGSIRGDKPGKDKPVKRALVKMCANCNRVKLGSAGWWDLPVPEAMIRQLRITHTTCPDCTRKLYPEIWRDIKEDGG